MSVRERIAQRILALRESLGVSQSEFSRLLDTPRSTVHAWESGRNKPDDETMLKVAKVLGTSISYLYGETDDPRPAPDWHTGAGPSTEAEARAQRAAALLREATALLDRAGENEAPPNSPA